MFLYLGQLIEIVLGQSQIKMQDIAVRTDTFMRQVRYTFPRRISFCTRDLMFSSKRYRLGVSLTRLPGIYD
jgi:hypothetical protein